MRTYRGRKTQELIFPLGGIGTGSVGMAGNGRFCDWEIFNKPDKGSINEYTHIAVKATDAAGHTEARVLQGDETKALMGQYMTSYYRGYGYGPHPCTMAGFPHFREHSFRGNFPFGKFSFSDKDFPCRVSLEAFNPMIPQDSAASSLPAAFFTVTFRNDSDKDLTCQAAFSLANPYNSSVNRRGKSKKDATVVLSGAVDDPYLEKYGNMTLCAMGDVTGAQTCWYRGGWMDPVSMFWREFTENARLSDRTYDTPGANPKDTATVWAECFVPAGRSKSVRFLLSWYHPYYRNIWDDTAKDSQGRPLMWRNWYATVFPDSESVARYCRKKWSNLRSRSMRFAGLFSRSTLPFAVRQAAACNLAVLKSPTVLRLEDGTFWGWEGVHEKRGSCEGTCTHVWNYAYALCYLFPDLERSIRVADYKYNLQDNGLCRFRLPLPPTKDRGWMMACVDGQMGGVIKSYREWKLSGDTEFLRSIWDGVKRSLEFAWREDNPFLWDTNRDGVLEGRQHHTLDMELFGPSAWLQGFYLAALKAGARMAKAMGEDDTAALWQEIYEKGRAFTDTELFNGKYYVQKVDLSDREQLRKFDGGVYDTYWNAEKGELKYQIGDGCSIDQLCGQWHATLVGLGDVFDPEQRRIALANLFRNNFATSQRDRYNCWRNYAINDEAGACICSYPEGAYKPAVPVPYTEECMHGFEYELAGLLISEGMIHEGVQVVEGIRDRYDGEKRNPYNEMECGSNYARSMASFALLPLFLGYVCDMTRGKIAFHPVVSTDALQAPFGTGQAFCNASFTNKSVSLEVIEGELALSVLELPEEYLGGELVLRVDGAPVSYEVKDGALTFAPVRAKSSVTLS